MNSKHLIRPAVSVIAAAIFFFVLAWSAFIVSAGPSTGPSNCIAPAGEAEGLALQTPTRDPHSYLPAVFQPLPTPTATPPVSVIVNGDFEAGSAGWGEYSSNGWQLILFQDNLPVPPLSGGWAVWLGGDYDEASILFQTVTVPQGNPMLTYWLWIASEDDCGYDIGGVLINEDVAVDAYWLCTDNNTGGWIRRDISLVDFAGQTVELEFAAFTDESLNSNMFVDDVSLLSVMVEPAAPVLVDGVHPSAGKAETGLAADAMVKPAGEHIDMSVHLRRLLE